MKFLSKAKSYFYAQRARRNARAESGRSMVEMLGVLAIIGVITVGAMIGYRYAMERIMTNSIITGVRARAVVIGQQRVLGHPLNLSEFHPDTEKDLIYGHFEVKVFEDYYQDGSGYQALEVRNIPKRVCEKIQDTEFPDDHITLVNGEEVGDTPQSCIPDGPTENTGNIHNAGDYFTAEYHNTVTFVFMDLEDVGCVSSEQCPFCNSCIDGFCTPDENGARCGGPSGGCCMGGRCLPLESPACRCITTYGDDPLGRAYACCLEGYTEETQDWTCCLNPDDAVCQEPADQCAGKTCGDCMRCDSDSGTCVADSDQDGHTCGSNGCSVCENGSCLNKMTQIKKCDGTKENCCPLTTTCTDETGCVKECTETPGPCQKCDTTTGRLVPDKEGESCGTCGTCTNGECQEQTKTVTTCSGERTCCLDDPTCQDETDCPCDPACGTCERCVSGVCQTDSSIPGCGGGCPNGCGECEVCENGTCVPDMTLPGCTKCNADDECPNCQLCDSATGKCQAVPDGNMCGDCKACQNGQCVDAGTTVITKCDRTTENCCTWNGTHTCEDETGCCETNDDCNKENCMKCDPTTKKCNQYKKWVRDCNGKPRTCCQDDDTCKDGVCVIKCATDADCGAGNTCCSGVCVLTGSGSQCCGGQIVKADLECCGGRIVNKEKGDECCGGKNLCTNGEWCDGKECAGKMTCISNGMMNPHRGDPGYVSVQECCQTDDDCTTLEKSSDCPFKCEGNKCRAHKKGDGPCFNCNSTTGEKEALTTEGYHIGKCLVCRQMTAVDTTSDGCCWNDEMCQKNDKCLRCTSQEETIVGTCVQKDDYEKCSCEANQGTWEDNKCSFNQCPDGYVWDTSDEAKNYTGSTYKHVPGEGACCPNSYDDHGNHSGTYWNGTECCLQEGTTYGATYKNQWTKNLSAGCTKPICERENGHWHTSEEAKSYIHTSDSAIGYYLTVPGKGSCCKSQSKDINGKEVCCHGETNVWTGLRSAECCEASGGKLVENSTACCPSTAGYTVINDCCAYTAYVNGTRKLGVSRRIGEPISASHSITCP